MKVPFPPGQQKRLLRIRKAFQWVAQGWRDQQKTFTHCESSAPGDSASSSSSSSSLDLSIVSIVTTRPASLLPLLKIFIIFVTAPTLIVQLATPCPFFPPQPHFVSFSFSHSNSLMLSYHGGDDRNNNDDKITMIMKLELLQLGVCNILL